MEVLVTLANKIFTSYYGRNRELEKAGIEIVNIARYAPARKYIDRYNIGWFAQQVAPSVELLKAYKNNEITAGEYAEVYIKQLNNLDQWTKSRIKDYLLERTQHNPIALCCWCGKNTFCHRHLLANWLNDMYNFKIEEY